MRRTLILAAVGAAAIMMSVVAPLAQSSGGYFSPEQAARGAAAFNTNCAKCHGQNLQGVEAPALVGVDVMGNWATAQGMYDYFSVAMPPTAPGKLGQPTYVDIMAHILEVNGAAAGQKDLTLADLPNVDLVTATAAAGAPAGGSKQNGGGASPAATVAPGGGAAAPSNATAAPAGSAALPAEAPSVPQAFTYGKQLPTVSPESAPAADAKPKPTVPQAFTYGKQLPTVAPATK